MNPKTTTVLSKIRQTLEAELKGMNLQNAELTEAEHAFIEEATTLIESAGYELDGFDTSDPDAVADALEQLADEEEGSEVAEQAMRLLAPAIVEEQGPVIAEVPSESNPSKKYQIRLGGDGNVYCSCPAWKYQKGKAPHERVCKHMKGLAKQIAQVTAKMAKAEDIGPLLAQHFSEELERGQTFIEQATALIQQAGYEMEDFEGASVEEMVDALAAVADEEGGELAEAAEELLTPYIGEGKKPVRCPDCGELGERKGHMGCQYPQD